MKRLTIELPLDQYEFLRRKAEAEGSTVSRLIRDLIHRCRSQESKKAKKGHRKDPFYERRGSFDGSKDLAEHHDAYLYGEESE